MPHDEKIIEAGKKFLLGRGAETLITEPSVGGGESPDVIGWFRPLEGPYYSELVECKRSLEDAHREHEKETPNHNRAGKRRWMLIPFDLWRDDGAYLEMLAYELKMGVVVWNEHHHNGEMTLPREAPLRELTQSALRTEQRILHDEFNRMRRRLAELEGTGPAPRNAKRNGTARLKQIHLDILDSNIGREASEKEVAALLKHFDDRLTKKEAAALARLAMAEPPQGFRAQQWGQDWYLDREPQTQGAT